MGPPSAKSTDRNRTIGTRHRKPRAGGAHGVPGGGCGGGQRDAPAVGPGARLQVDCPPDPTQIDRKTVRRYVEAAVSAGMRQADGEAQITDGLVGEVIDAVRPARPGSHGHAWAHPAAPRGCTEPRLKGALSLPKTAPLSYPNT